MKTAKELLIDLIKQSEGCSLVAYRCPAGKITIGWGVANSTIKMGDKWSQLKCDNILASMAEKVLEAALKASPILIDETPQRQAAIADFIYNLGINGYVGHSLKPYVDAGNWNKAAIEIKKFCHAGGKKLPGLVKRRAIEAAMLI